MVDASPQAGVRPLAMRLHRWVALALGLWFALLGASGSTLVWHAQIDAALNPSWFSPRPACGSVPAGVGPVERTLDVYARATGGAEATQVMAPAVPGAAHVVWGKSPTTGLRRQHFVDAACRAYIGHRDWGALRFDRAHLVPALYELHRSLLLREAGHTAVGVVGLLLLGVVLTGVITAWPRTTSRAAWRRTLTVKAGAAPRRRYYDLHRATGIWMFAFLLLMSVSGAYLCFPKQGRALVATLLPTVEAAPQATTVNQVTPVGAAALGPDALLAKAETLWPDASWSRVQLPRGRTDDYEVRLLQPGEPRADTGDTRVRLSAQGQVLDVRDPLHAPSGEILLAWLFPLHSGEALGLPGRIAWTLFGWAPPLLFATGAWLWWQRRRAQARRDRVHPRGQH